MRARAVAVRGAIAAAAFVSLLALTGCTSVTEVDSTVSPAKLAQQVGDTLTQRKSVVAAVDCGHDAIHLVEGNVLHCRVWAKDAPKPDQVADATVTITRVRGARYDFTVSIGESLIDADAALPPQTN